MSTLITILIVLFVLLIILFMPIGVGAKYENGVFVIVKIALFSFDIPINKVIKKPSGKKKKRKEEKPKKPEDDLEKGIIGLDFILSLFGNFRRFVRKKVRLSDFKLKISIGTSDAASTAVTTGLLWSLSYNLLGLIDKLVLVKDPIVKVEPEFNQATFSITAQGIFATCIANIIAVAVVFVFKFLKYKNKKTRRKKL